MKKINLNELGAMIKKSEKGAASVASIICNVAVVVTGIVYIDGMVRGFIENKKKNKTVKQDQPVIIHVVKENVPSQNIGAEEEPEESEKEERSKNKLFHR